MDREPTELRPVPRQTAEGAGAGVEVMDAELSVRFDIGDWVSEEREQLIAYLEEVPIPFLLVDDDTIEAVPGYEDELTTAVLGPTRPTPFQRRQSIVSLDGRPLGLARRVTAAVIDGAVAAAAVVAMAGLVEDQGLVALVLLTVLGVNHVIGLGERGRSVGKTVVGAHVRSTKGRPLSATEAAVRWAVRDGLVLLALGVAVAIDDASGIFLLLQLAGLAFMVVLAASVLRDQQLRGFHDELVDSAVVEATSMFRGTT